MSRGQAIVDTAVSKDGNEKIWDAFRRWGYLQANIDPLGDLKPVSMPELDVQGPDAEAARRYYCASIGVEFMHGFRNAWKRMRHRPISSGSSDG
jgi:2-oxoglutarate dehydrogenase complex dehydrogenase (E1) component-like enzyme